MLPLRSTVVFPLTVQPLAVNRPVSVDAVNRALAADRMLVLVMQVGDADDPTPAQLRKVGTVAVVRQMAKGAMGLQVLVEGIARVRLDDVTRDGNVMDAAITAAPEPDSPDARDRRVRADAARSRREGLLARDRAVARPSLDRRRASTSRCGSSTCSRPSST